MNDYGDLKKQTDHAFVRFERQLEAAIDVVWDLIATGNGLEQWLAPAEVDLREGGVVDLDFGEEGLAGGAIIAMTPGSVLEYHWQFPGERDSIIRFELEATDRGTLLTLEHRLLPLDQCVGYGAGWHAHLDHLAAVARHQEPGSWDDRFTALLPEYQALA